MKQDRDREERIERALVKAWRGQPVREPSDAWQNEVMQAIRAEPCRPQVIPLVAQVRLAWRAACVTAAAAVIVAVVGYRIMPSDAQLVGQLQRDGIWSVWVLQSGE